MKIATVVQARMSSSRFPGKVLYRVAGKPLLQHLLERLAVTAGPQSLIVATSTEPSDTPVEHFCTTNGVSCYRGPLENVARRFAEVVEKFNLDGFVRVSGDSPLLDPNLVAKAREILVASKMDLVTNVHPRTFPRGQSVEAVRTTAFLRGFRCMTAPEDLEHVTPYFYRHAEDFQIYNWSSGEDWNTIDLCIDHPADVGKVERLLGVLDGSSGTSGVREVVEAYRRAA